MTMMIMMKAEGEEPEGRGGDDCSQCPGGWACLPAVQCKLGVDLRGGKGNREEVVVGLHLSRLKIDCK